MNKLLIIKSLLKEAAVGIKQVVDIKPEWYRKNKNHFTFELSEVDNFFPAKEVYLRNPKSKNETKFHQIKIDKDSTDEDIYGWNYKSEDGQYTLLVIND